MHSNIFNGILVSYHFTPAPFAGYGEEQESPRVSIVSATIDGLPVDDAIALMDEEFQDEMADYAANLEAHIVDFELCRA